MSYINDMQNNISNVIVFDEKISTYVFYTNHKVIFDYLFKSSYMPV